MRKIRVVSITTIFALLMSMAAHAFSGKEIHVKSSDARSTSKSDAGSLSEITWNKNRKLTWDDFKGAIPRNAEEYTAAATFCGIGFETNTITSNDNNLKIRVYNTFYPDYSWARPDEKNDEILAHEQGHFDLCELYTRKLRQRMSNVQVNVNTLKPVLRRIYDQLQEEYKDRQQAYEDETEHGVNTPQQERWQKILENELLETEHWSDVRYVAER